MMYSFQRVRLESAVDVLLLTPFASAPVPVWGK